MTSAQKQFNRRQAERFLMNVATVALVDQLGEVQLMDISVRGARIRHLRPVPIGGEVRLKFKPTPQSITLALTGRVIWTEPLDPMDPEGERLSGLQFNDEAAGLQSALERLCESGGATRI